LAELLTNPDLGTKSVRIRNARIVGAVDLTAAQVLCPLQLERCRLDERVVLTEATTRSMRFFDCTIPSVMAYQLRTRGNFEVSQGSRIEQINLSGANIDGAFGFDGATLDNPGGVSIAAGADFGRCTSWPSDDSRLGETQRPDERLALRAVEGQSVGRTVRLRSPTD
jgi:hypothetical protein